MILREHNPLASIVDRIHKDTPFSQPGCILNEHHYLSLLVLTYLNPNYLNIIKLRQPDNTLALLKPPRQYVASQLLKNIYSHIGSEETALVLSSSNPLFEGTIVHSPYLSAQPMRTLYAKARYDNGSYRAWHQQLSESLALVQLPPPGKDMSYLELLLSLIRLQELPLGDNFEANTLEYSKFLKEHKRADKNWPAP